MHWFQPAARRYGRVPLLLLLSGLLLVLSVHSEAAPPASLSVKIRQLNPDGQIQQVTCTPNTKCVLPVDIQTGATKETLTVQILFVPNNVVMRFQTPSGYLFTGARNPTDKYALYEGRWRDTPATGKTKAAVTTLFIPLRPHPEVGLSHEDMKQPVADLEITTEQLP
jgi:hypothetical protein